MVTAEWLSGRLFQCYPVKYEVPERPGEIMTVQVAAPHIPFNIASFIGCHNDAGEFVGANAFAEFAGCLANFDGIAQGVSRSRRRNR